MIRRRSHVRTQAKRWLQCRSGTATLCRSRCSFARPAGQRRSPGLGASTSPFRFAKWPTCCQHKALIVQPTHQPAGASKQLVSDSSIATCHGKVTHECTPTRHACCQRCTGCAWFLSVCCFPKPLPCSSSHIDSLVHLPQHILCGHLTVLKHQLAGVAAPHSKLIQLLRRVEALHQKSKSPEVHSAARWCTCCFVHTCLQRCCSYNCKSVNCPQT